MFIQVIKISIHCRKCSRLVYPAGAHAKDLSAVLEVEAGELVWRHNSSTDEVFP